MVDRDFEHMQEIPTHPFFHHEILEATPCLKFRHSVTQRAPAPEWKSDEC